jgi:alkylation response protein AidB-like acyl-CoA dehydrogenase
VWRSSDAARRREGVSAEYAPKGQRFGRTDSQARQPHQVHAFLQRRARNLLDSGDHVQIQSGNGYAEEYLASRLLIDARVLSIVEGANEIQAHVIARRLLEEGEAP